MLKALLDFLLNRKGHPVQSDSAAPYKVETPGAVNAIAEPAKCGCGRSPTGNCVGHHKLTDAEWAAHPDNKNGNNWPFPQAAAPAEAKEMKPAVKAKSVKAKKAPAAAITAAEKPKKAKAPAKPRAKKAKE